MRIPLSGKAYQERSIIANAQQTINLIAEFNTDDKEAPVPVTYYPTPGTVLFGTPADPNPVRGMYRTTLGTAFVVVGSSVYFLATNGAMIFISNIVDRPSRV